MMKEKKVLALSVALFISLALNFYAGGSMIGHEARSYLGHAKGHDWKERAKIAKKFLPQEDRDLLRRSFQQSREEMRGLKAEIERAQKAVFAAARTEPFSQKALDRALAAENQKRKELFSLMRKTRQGAVEKMTPEGRAGWQKMQEHLKKKKPEESPERP